MVLFLVAASHFLPRRLVGMVGLYLRRDPLHRTRFLNSGFFRLFLRPRRYVLGAVVYEDLVIVAELSAFVSLRIYFGSQIDHQVGELLFERDEVVDIVSRKVLHATSHAASL